MFSSPWAAQTIHRKNIFFNCQHNKIGGEQLCCNRLIKNVAVYKLFAVHDNYWTNKSGFSTRLHDSMIVLLDERQYFSSSPSSAWNWRVVPRLTRNPENFSYEDVQIEANISRSQGPSWNIHIPESFRMYFFGSTSTGRGTLLPRGQNTIWLIDFMICKQFMSEKKILLSHFILLLNVVRDTMAWRRENKKRKISRLFSLNILFRAFHTRFDISCRTISSSDVPRVL